MIHDPTDEELLGHLLAGEADGGQLEQLAGRAGADPDLARQLSSELRFSALLREALRPSGDAFSRDLESASLGAGEWARRIREGSATPFECDQVAKLFADSPAAIHDLRRDLAADEWLRLAVSGRKSEQAFVESLETRMWAETRRDHFVEDFTKRLERELAPVPTEEGSGKVLRFPPLWMGALLRMGAAAAVAALGAFVAVQFATGRFAPAAASVVKQSADAAWSENASPANDGSLRPGRYELKSGVVSMRLASGGELTVEGPTVFEVDRDASTKVLTGIALAKAPENEPGAAIQARGLSVSKPARLVGIDARAESATEAIVFNGDGGICLSENGRCRDLSQFEAVKADHLRQKLVDVPYNPRAFSKTWAMVAGVENNLGPVRIELPGSVISAAGGVEGEVRVFLENEAFRPAEEIRVDRIVAGEFSVAGANEGEALNADGDLRSYLLQLDPIEAEEGARGVETSLTFDHPVVGVIFSSDRLEGSDSMVGTTLSDEPGQPRGMDSGDDRILLSDDRRTLNLRFSGSGEHTEQVRVLVALN